MFRQHGNDHKEEYPHLWKQVRLHPLVGVKTASPFSYVFPIYDHRIFIQRNNGKILHLPGWHSPVQQLPGFQIPFLDLYAAAIDLLGYIGRLINIYSFRFACTGYFLYKDGVIYKIYLQVLSSPVQSLCQEGDRWYCRRLYSKSHHRIQRHPQKISMFRQSRSSVLHVSYRFSAVPQAGSVSDCWV